MKAADILARYSHNPTGNIPQKISHPLELEPSTDQDSPLQVAMKSMLYATIKPEMLKVAAKFIPDLQSLVDLIENPIELHKYVVGAINLMGGVIRRDHECGYTDDGNIQERCTICGWTDPERSAGIVIAQGGEESAKSVCSGDDRHGEINANGSVDGTIYEGVLIKEERASQSTDS